MDKYRQQAMEFWTRWTALSTAHKAAWSFVVAVVVVSLAALYYIAQPEYRVLYTGLSGEEAGAITNKLQAKGISFKLAAGGSTILVPTEQVMQVHVDMTSEGIPGSTKIGKGLDMFDQPMLGATPFNQHVNFLRAQQAELARTIMQIDPIVFARVHIVRPEPSPFIREQKPTTASIMVKLRPGVALNRTTVAGIVALVSGSVEGLAKENVRVVDTVGRLLTENRDPETGMGASFIEQRKEMERYLSSEAEQMLTKVLGPGRAIVRVTAELNTKHGREKKYTPSLEGRVEKKKQETESSTSSGSSAKGGIAGAQGQKPQAGGGVAGSNKKEQTSHTEFDYPTTSSEWEIKLGAIDRLTVAAFVDTTNASGEAAMQLGEVQKIIKNAVGFKAERDDIQVTQVRMPAAVPEVSDTASSAHQPWQMILLVIRNGSIAIVCLCLCPIVWILVRRLLDLTKPATAPPPSDKMDRLAEELSRNPELFTKLLSEWIEQADTPDRAAA